SNPFRRASHRGGCSSAWLERQVVALEVASSNLVIHPIPPRRLKTRRLRATADEKSVGVAVSEECDRTDCSGTRGLRAVSSPRPRSLAPLSQHREQSRTAQLPGASTNRAAGAGGSAFLRSRRL